MVPMLICREWMIPGQVPFQAKVDPENTGMPWPFQSDLPGGLQWQAVALNKLSVQAVRQPPWAHACVLVSACVQRSYICSPCRQDSLPKGYLSVWPTPEQPAGRGAVAGSGPLRQDSLQKGYLSVWPTPERPAGRGRRAGGCLKWRSCAAGTRPLFPPPHPPPPAPPN